MVRTSLAFYIMWQHWCAYYASWWMLFPVGRRSTRVRKPKPMFPIAAAGSFLEQIFLKPKRKMFVQGSEVKPAEILVSLEEKETISTSSTCSGQDEIIISAHGGRIALSEEEHGPPPLYNIAVHASPGVRHGVVLCCARPRCSRSARYLHAALSFVCRRIFPNARLTGTLIVAGYDLGGLDSLLLWFFVRSGACVMPLRRGACDVRNCVLVTIDFISVRDQLRQTPRTLSVVGSNTTRSSAVAASNPT